MIQLFKKLLSKAEINIGTNKEMYSNNQTVPNKSWIDNYNENRKNAAQKTDTSKKYTVGKVEYIPELYIPGINYKILCFADLSLIEDNDEQNLISIYNSGTVGLVLLLGDISGEFLTRIKRLFTTTAIIGIPGNHDCEDLLEAYSIVNAHGKLVEYDGIKITGLHGSFRYKDSDFPSFTQEESINFAEKLQPADIFITHTSPSGIHEFDKFAHSGLAGNKRYIETHAPRINIHGHMHRDLYSIYSNGTAIIGVYGAALIDPYNRTLEKIF